jgi:hypothetical protein
LPQPPTLFAWDWKAARRYAVCGDQLAMNWEQRQHLRRRIPLLTYLKQQGWKPTAYSESDKVCGVCPLHRDSRPSFYVNRRKDVFYCRGCGQGSDVIRPGGTAAWADFRAALAALMGQDTNRQRLWSDACDFYQHQLWYRIDAQSYLRSRGIEDQETIDRMRIGYAPGGCLRAYLEDLGYARAAMVSSGLIDAQGRDRLWRAITFPLAEAASIYGRHTFGTKHDPAVGRHRFLARPKGGLYGWDRARGGLYGLLSPFIPSRLSLLRWPMTSIRQQT